MRQYAIGLSFVAMAGCSFVFVSGPPANHRERPAFDCTSGRALPIVDTVIGGLQVLNVATTLALSDAEWDEIYEPNEAPIARKTMTAIYGASAAVFVASAVYGFMRTGTCRRAKDEWTARMQQGGGTPGQPGVAPQPGTWPPPAGTQPGTPPPAGTGPGTWPPPPPPAPAPAPPAPAPVAPAGAAPTTY